MKNRNLLLAIIIIVLVIIAAFYMRSSTAPVLPVDEQLTTATSSPNTASTTPSTNPVSNPGSTAKTPVAQRPTRGQDGAFLVYYTNTGFTPSTITLIAGGNVRFVNDSSRAMKIYPTLPDDLLYGKLKQTNSVGRNGTFSYNFSQKGVYGYYNDNNSADHGIIIVK